jgi:hypothetical protein
MTENIRLQLYDEVYDYFNAICIYIHGDLHFQMEVLLNYYQELETLAILACVGKTAADC